MHGDRGAKGLGRRQPTRRRRWSENRICRIGDPIEILVPDLLIEDCTHRARGSDWFQYVLHTVTAGFGRCHQGGAERVVDRNSRIAAAQLGPRLYVAAWKDGIVEVEFMEPEQDVGFWKDTESRYPRPRVA